MNTNDLSLSFNEKVVFKLRSIYSVYGYAPYKMGKFEEYDLYATNKDFLISDSIITFTDTNGKLMALKPDVTLSIVKNSLDEPMSIQKVYYNENVYRISKGTHTFKEIMQVGLECFGDIDNYCISEVLTLACKSLKAISDDCVLDISHLGIITTLFDSFDIPSGAKAKFIKYIGEKNVHELLALCTELELDDDKTSALKALVTNSGDAKQVLCTLKELIGNVADVSCIDQLACVIDALDDECKNMIRVDFSVISDTHYYNGITFKGFINGVPASVLSGGQYDKLMQKMKRKSGAIGFAVYLDVIDRLEQSISEYDADVLVLYNNSTPLSLVNNTVKEITISKQTAFACKCIPIGYKFKNLINLTDCEVNSDENNA